MTMTWVLEGRGGVSRLAGPGLGLISVEWAEVVTNVGDQRGATLVYQSAETTVSIMSSHGIRWC